MTDLTIYRHFNDFVLQQLHIDDLGPYFDDFWKLNPYVIFFILRDFLYFKSELNQLKLLITIAYFE